MAKYRKRPPRGAVVPEEYIDEPQYQFIKYDITLLDRVAYMEASFRIIDVETGLVDFSFTDQVKKEAKGRFSQGLRVAGIPSIHQKVPPDVELLQMASEEISIKFAKKILERYEYQADKYFAKGEVYRKELKFDKAIEKYVDCIIDVEELKSESNKYKEAKERIKQVIVEMGLE